MGRKLLGTLALATALSISGAAFTQSNPAVGGAPMFAEKTIVENAVNSPIHTTLVAAVKAAGLVDTLNGSGPFTVFAPVNSAFEKLPAGTVHTLLQPENKDMLTAVLTYHVVPGDLSGSDLLSRANAGGSQAELTTVQGETLTVVPSGQGIAVVDSNGTSGVVTIADVDQSNGVIHVINSVMQP